MARVSTFVLTFLLFVLSSFVSAAPIETRQIGGIRCNLGRLQTVANLSGTIRNVNRLATAAASDPAAQAAAETALTALRGSQAGISQIAGALITLQEAPASGREAVEKGFAEAKAALESVQSADPAIMDAVGKAMNSLAKAADGGAKVVATCV